MTYKKTEIIVTCFLLCFCAFAWLSLYHLPTNAKMFPNIIIGTMFISLLILLVRSAFGVSERIQGSTIAGWKFFVHYKRFFLSVFLFSLCLFVIEKVGFFITSTLLIFSMAFLVGYRKYVSLIAATIGFLVLVYIVFVLVFERPLPKEFFLTDITEKSCIIGDLYV